MRIVKSRLDSRINTIVCDRLIQSVLIEECIGTFKEEAAAPARMMEPQGVTAEITPPDGPSEPPDFRSGRKWLGVLGVLMLAAALVLLLAI